MNDKSGNKSTKNYEKIYLEDIHENLDQDSLLDLHTYFWSKDFRYCPICTLRLFMTPEGVEVVQ